MVIVKFIIRWMHGGFSIKRMNIKRSHTKRLRPFYRYDPNQCILCGRCVEACQDIEVNETIRIDWDREHPRVIWDNDVPINESSCISCGQCATVCPCNAMMEVNMEGNAGYMTDTEPGSLAAMIDLTKKQNLVMVHYLQSQIQKQKCVKSVLRKLKQCVLIVVWVVHLKFGLKIEKF